jgi:hypothetical protein
MQTLVEHTTFSPGLVGGATALRLAVIGGARTIRISATIASSAL